MKKASKNFIYSLSKEFGKRCADIWDTEKQIFFPQEKSAAIGVRNFAGVEDSAGE